MIAFLSYLNQICLTLSHREWVSNVNRVVDAEPTRKDDVDAHDHVDGDVPEVQRSDLERAWHQQWEFAQGENVSEFYKRTREEKFGMVKDKNLINADQVDKSR